MTLTDAIEDSAIPAELCVLQGRLKGARCALQLGRPTTVGAGPDNDIVLTAADIGIGRVSLQLRGPECVVRVLSGEVAAEGRSWPAGTEFALALPTPLKLGAAVMTVVAQSVTSAGHAGKEPVREVHPVDRVLEPRQARLSHGLPTELWRLALFNRRGWLAAGATVSALSLGGMAVGSSAQEGSVDLRHSAATFESALHDAGFTDLRVQLADGRALRVTGYLDTAIQRAAVASMLGQLGAPGRLEVWVNAALVAAVQEVFRAHHVAARAVPEGPGRVVVHTQEGDATRLQSIVSRAKRDVPGLRSLELHNVAPSPTAEPSDVLSVQPHNPGKRIAAIVPGDPAYVVTVDGSRYFEGAVLPSGLRITAIRPGDVQFERDAVVNRHPF